MSWPNAGEGRSLPHIPAAGRGESEKFQVGKEFQVGKKFRFFLLCNFNFYQQSKR